MIRTIITGLYTLGAHAASKGASWWMHRNGRWSTESIAQRSGRALPKSNAANPIWIHAASMGEVRVGAALACALADYGHAVLGSAMTETGFQQIGRTYPASSIAIRAPFDIPSAVAHVCDHYSPSALVLVETEWWPNLIRTCARRRIPIFIVNGRVSDQAFKSYRKTRAYWRHVLSDIEFFYMRYEIDADRIRELGIDPQRVAVFGSMKASLAPVTSAMTHDRASRFRQSDRRVWVAGSTRPGEEEIILQAHRQLQSDHPGLQLWIAPRHPERFDEVARLVTSNGLSLRRWSENASDTDTTADVILIDSMGILPELYEFADAAFIGGSLKPYGGHNPLEPALVGTPVLFGPHMESQRESGVLLLRENLAEMTADLDELVQAVGLRLFHGLTIGSREARIARLREHLPDVTRVIANDLVARMAQLRVKR